MLNSKETAGPSPAPQETMRRILLVLSCLLCFAGCALGANPVPFINWPLSPGAAAPGGPALSLKVSGCMFVPGAVVYWDGQPLTTSFISESKLAASVPASDIATTRTVSVTVMNPGTPVASNPVLFQVATPESTVFYQDAPGYPAGLDPQEWTGDAGNDDLAVGDFLGNGQQDLAFGAVTSPDSPLPTGSGLSVLLGKGDGTFSTLPLQVTNQVGFGSAIGEGDFNGDSKPDLAVANGKNDTVTVMLNYGNGSFAEAAGSPISVGPEPTGTAVGDFNRDGKLDLAVSNSDLKDSCTSATCSPNGSVSVLLGNGDGTFMQAPGSPIAQPPTSFFGPNEAAVGDLNGDGNLDLAMISGSGQLWVLLGNGDGTFENAPGTPTSYPLPYSFAMAAGDFNGDGRLDLAMAGMSQHYAATVLLGNGDGTFTQVKDCCGFGEPGITYNEYMTRGDFNGDGMPDLAILTNQNSLPQGASFVQILLGNGDGTFSPTDYAVWMNASPQGIAEGDFDGSGRLGTAVLGAAGAAMWSFVQVSASDWPHPPPDFTVTAQDSSLTVKPGGTATDKVTISSQYGFYGEITGEECRGVPALAKCTFSPAVPPAVFPRMMAPLENFYYTISIATTAPNNTSSSAVPVAPKGPLGGWPPTLWVLLAGVIFALWIFVLPRKRVCTRALLVIATLICLGAVFACGSKAPKSLAQPPPTPSGTPPGTYTITVSASSPSGGGLTHSVHIALTVQ